MRKIGIILVACIVFAGSVEAAFAFRYATAKITFKVMDKDNKPVEDAWVRGGFYARDTKGGGPNINGYTNNEGLISSSGRTHGELGYRIQKNGYYSSHGRYRKWYIEQAKIEADKWQPWNPVVEVLLKKIENPVPMYAKKVETEIPLIGKPVAYDLEIGDWVAPYGKGVIGDFVFTFTGVFKRILDRKEQLRLTFSNEADGIREVVVDEKNQRSVLVLPYLAPEGEYQASWFLEKMLSPDGTRKNLKTRHGYNYIFRVRTVRDEQGNIVRANYGKIHGDIEFGFSSVDGSTAIVIFTYYFNPDGTRNLEFDPQKNLFHDLRSLEKVASP